MIDGSRPLHLALVFALLATSACSQTLSPQEKIPDVSTPLPMAFMVGEVAPNAATLWVRCAGGNEVVVSVAPSASDEIRANVDPNRDFTARIPLVGLVPATNYRYTVWCRGGETHSPGTGSFTTAPEDEARVEVRFAWAGDVGGQNVCRDKTHGYFPFRAVRSTNPDFFVALGDMIYADDRCLATGRYGNEQIVGPAAPALDVDAFRSHWRYQRADPSAQNLYAATSTYAIWDDHEIKNDAGPHHQTAPGHRRKPLLAPARAAFLDYHPLSIDSQGTGPLYRNVRWGRHLELFILDTRSYRDANSARDSPTKSMLGAAQRKWLLDALRQSDATWKVIVSSVPISVPTGDPKIGRDGWANFDGKLGFENELTEILRTIQRLTRRQVLWITTDVHFGSVIRYRPFPDDEDFVFHEILTGPLNSGIFPRRELDHTFRPERLYLHGPESADDVKSLVDALRWFNFGSVEIDAAGTLKARILTGTGEPAFELELQP